MIDISIHALREEGDIGKFSVIALCNISIHALREEGDQIPNIRHFRRSKFLSTPSARRATSDGNLSGYILEFLSTPSARRATAAVARRQPAGGISIHALREEGDDAPRCGRLGLVCISIHALREEGDGGVRFST